MSDAVLSNGNVKVTALQTIPAATDGVEMSRLVGKPHLFAKMKSLRNGLLIQPIGVMTLQSDGRITGYANPNEGSWIPYEHGEVAARKALALVTAKNHWIPSSTWTQSMGDIPVGFFCDEPEIAHAVDRLCLVPHHVNTDPNSVVYLVASCLKFYDKTVPLLLSQMFAEGIEPSRIKVVVNGCETNSDRTIDGIEHAFSTHDGWEWSALYEAPLRWKFRYCFLIHDTSIIFPGFRRSVESFNDHVAWDYLPASPLARWADAVLKEAWERYRIPVAITEAHLGGGSEDQIRWPAEIWNAAQAARLSGVDVRAVTVWALFGSWNWCNLCTSDEKAYEPGVFDLTRGKPQPTPLSAFVSGLAQFGNCASPELAKSAWWHNAARLLYKET
ncbi:MAG: hypothetical protein ACRYFU_22975 [Janthinobacterium lividum]